MSNIGKNIRKIRTVKGLSQAAFAEIFDIKRANIGAYEEGRAEPKVDLTTRIANHFSLPLEALLTREITVNELSGFAPFTRPWSKETLVSKSSNTNSDLPAVIRMVLPHEVQRYCHHYTSEEYLNTLPPLQLPYALFPGTRALEVRGHEMSWGIGGLQHGDIVFGELVPSNEWRQVPTNQRYVWVMEETILIRRLASVEKHQELQADNPEYPNEKLVWKSVQEVWRITGVLNLQPDGPTHALHQRLEVLEDAVKKLSGS